MNPDRASQIFRELLQTPSNELIHLPRRLGLEGSITPPDLEQAKELLQVIFIALQSAPGPNWARVNTAWGAVRSQHGALPAELLAPSKPTWVRNLPPAPSLGDPAPFQQGYPNAQSGSPGPAYPTPSPPYGMSGPPQVATYPSPGAPPPPMSPAPPAHGQVAVGHAAGYPPTPHGYYGTPGVSHSAAQPAPQPQPAPPQPQPQPQPQPAPQPAPSGSGSGFAIGQVPPGDIRTSVAKYAAFCAACAAQPDRVFMTQVEYGITSPEARVELDETWQDRFDEDGEAHALWERLFRQFRRELGA